MRIQIVFCDKVFELKKDHVLIINDKTVELYETTGDSNSFGSRCNTILKMPLEFLTGIKVLNK